MTHTARKSAAAKMQLFPKIQLFLRIKHPHIDPAEITSALQLKPEHANKSGPAVSARGVKKLHSESYWLAALPVIALGELMEWNARALTEHVRDPAKPPTFPGLRLMDSAGRYDAQLIYWLKKLESQQPFIKRLVDGGGTITLVLQRQDREAALSVGPVLARLLADLEIRLEID